MRKPPAATTLSCSICHSALIFSIAAFFSSSERSGLVLTSSICLLMPPPKTISVPRPAMLVAIVTTPGRPASSTIWASRSCCLAFNTLCLIPSLSKSLLSASEFSIEVVPNNTGCWRLLHSLISSIMAWYFSLIVRKTLSCWSTRIIFL